MAGGGAGPAARRWEARVRELADRAARAEQGACFVEGIRAVLSAEEAGVPFEAVLVCPERLRSPAALAAVERIVAAGAVRAELPAARFARLSDMDNPVGLAAVLRWRPVTLSSLAVAAGALVVVAEDVGDPGNLGTILRTADAAGAAAAVVAGGGTDAAHRACLRASLGTAFHLPVATARDGVEAVHWAGGRGLRTAATSAHADCALWDAGLRAPVAVVLGSEERGLRPETAAACDVRVRIPMLGTATSLNVAVAAGVLLYEVVRGRAGAP